MHINDEGLALGLEALGFGGSAPPVSPGKVKGSWFGKASFLTVLACLVVVGLVGVYFAGKALLFSPTHGGPDGGAIGHECFILDPSHCLSLDIRYIEKLSGMRFPPGAEVVNSGSSRFLLLGREWATVRWPEGTQVPAPRRTTDADRFYTSVEVSVGTDGRPQLSLERIWDG